MMLGAHERGPDATPVLLDSGSPYPMVMQDNFISLVLARGEGGFRTEATLSSSWVWR